MTENDNAPRLEVRQDLLCENEMFTVVGGVELTKKEGVSWCADHQTDPQQESACRIPLQFSGSAVCFGAQSELPVSVEKEVERDELNEP